MGDFAHHFHDRWSQLLGAIRFDECDRNIRFHTAQFVQKINVKVGAPELAIGNAIQAHVLLEFDDFGNRLVFHQAKLLCRDGSIGLLFTRVQQVFGAQKTADMVVMGGIGSSQVSFGFVVGRNSRIFPDLYQLIYRSFRRKDYTGPQRQSRYPVLALVISNCYI